MCTPVVRPHSTLLMALKEEVTLELLSMGLMSMVVARSMLLMAEGCGLATTERINAGATRSRLRDLIVKVMLIALDPT